ncbi:MAG: efflux RND transporter periplasmic adaptor subunit [Acidobacteria bacterium]|nr:efflux RND transporter periplasmic adaptor subunit [Acidobacteriota bacterium]
MNPSPPERNIEGGSHRSEPTPTGRRRLPVVIVLVAVIAGVGYFAMTRRAVPEERAAAPASEKTAGVVRFLMEQQWLIRLKLAKAEARIVAPQITATGRVIPAAKNQAVVAPPVGGLIADGRLPRIGQRVSSGQIIAVLRQMPTAAETSQLAAANSQLRIEAARLEAERRRLTGMLNAARAEMEYAKREYERTQRLYEKQAASQRQVEADESRFKTAAAVYNAAVQELELLNASRRLTEVQQEMATTYNVVAPISGEVVKVHKAIGEQVAPGEAIIEIINLETVWVEAPIFERDLARLGGDARATFTTSAHPGAEFVGRILNIGAVIDEQTRAANVVFEVPNYGRALRIGMQADVRLNAGASIEAVTIPKASVLEHEGKQIVYVLLSGEEFERREVTIGDEYGDKVAVTAGLKAGERIVTQGAYQLKLQELRPADAGAHSHET